MNNARTMVSVFIAIILTTTFTVGCSFTGVKSEAETIPLTEDEIGSYNIMFEQLLFDEEGNVTILNPLSHFLNSYYDKPEDIDLSRFLRHFPSENVKDEAEFEALKAEENWPFGDISLKDMYVPIHRISLNAVNEALKEHMGITLKDLSGVGADGLIYLKEYRAYYNFTSDFDAGYFYCASGERQGDIIRLTERAQF